MVEQEILSRIQGLLKTNHWSIYKLAKESGLPYSTLSNIFNRETCPGIPVIKDICRGFGISLSQFFDFDETPVRDKSLAKEEDNLLGAYRSLSEEDKKLAGTYIRGLCKK